MKLTLLTIACFLLFGISMGNAQQSGEAVRFEKNTLIEGLKDPWNILVDQDGQIWLTESKRYKVYHLDPQQKRLTMLLDLSGDRHFPRYDSLPEEVTGGKPWPQGGLMGMALHPQLLEGKPYVYLAYVYDFEGSDAEGDGRDEEDKGFHFKTKLARYTYDSESKQLRDPITICDTIPGSNDHNGGRMLIAKHEGEEYLFYSVGDMGAGQYQNAARPNKAQLPESYEGKILRFSLEPRKKADGKSGWIPGDNPFQQTQISAVWALGLRNTQGFASIKFGEEEKLYASDHGPYSDDEINIIQKGGNYGHPLIIGYADGNYDCLAASVTAHDSLPGKWNTTYPLIASELENAEKLDNYKDPLHSFYPHPQDFLVGIMEKIRDGKEERPDWKAVAPSGICAYTSDAIPGWKNSLLVTSLQEGTLYRLKLDDAGTEVAEVEALFKSDLRYRDVAVSPDGNSIYLTTDQAPDSEPTKGEKDAEGGPKGAVLEFRFRP